MNNKLSSSIDIADENARYDAQCKLLLSNKQVLAWILKYSTEEFKDCSIKDIAQKYIEGTPQLGSISVNSDETAESIRGINTEDSAVNEGKITYDIRFLATAPNNNDEPIELIINIEAQNDYSKNYPIEKRGIYYCSRMISAQKGIEFNKSHYEKIKKVYSIWVCPSPPQENRNTITRFEFKPVKLIGNAAFNKKNYDLMNLVFIELGSSEDNNYTGVLQLLEILLSSDKKPTEKKQLLHNVFEFELTESFEKEVSDMCNLSKGVELKGIEKGLKQGIEQGIEQGLKQGLKNGISQAKYDSVKKLMLKLNLTLEQAMDILEIPLEEKYKYLS